MPGNDNETIARIRAYLLEGFDQVEIAPQRDSRTGSALIAVWEGSIRRVVELTDVLLDADADLAHPVDAVRAWDLIGTLKKSRAGAVVKVSTRGVDVVA